MAIFNITGMLKQTSQFLILEHDMPSVHFSWVELSDEIKLHYIISSEYSFA